MVLKRLGHYLLNFIYPSTCLYCTQRLDSPERILCLSCSSTLHLAYHHPAAREIYCFEYHSAARPLLKAFEKMQYSKIRELIVSFMVIQYMQQGRAMPDLIIPAFQADLFSCNRVNTALAQALAKRLDKPYVAALQFVLKPSVYDQQGKLVGKVILRKRAFNIAHKTEHILIVDGCTYAPEKNREALADYGYTNTTYLSALFKTY